MFNKNLLLRVSSLLVVGLMIATTAGISYAAGPSVDSDNKKDADDHTPSAVMGMGNTAALALPSSGMGSIDLINYDGANETLTVDFAGVTYQIPGSPNGGSGVWNHAQIFLAPGTYNYTASVPGNDTVLNNTIEVVAGKVTSLGFYDNIAETQNGDKGGDDKTPEGNSASVGEQHRLAHDSDDLLVGVADETAQAH
jgi:hypothetical protein